MRIEERVSCPHCGQRRVIERARHAYLCFQCRHAFTADPDATRWTFSPDELRRLRTYRAAVQGGFYTDWPA